MDEIIWERIYEIIRKFSLGTGTSLPDELLAETLMSELPTDKGFSLIEMNGTVPRCIRWPAYSADFIPDFNTRLNKNVPQVYNPLSSMLGPVNWSHYSQTEYDRDFNRPLNIGYSLGIGIYDGIHQRNLIFCLHKSRKSESFQDYEVQILSLIRPVIQGIFNRRYQLQLKLNEEIIPRETAPGCRKLSKREREVLQYLLTRESIKEIAENLKISPRTIETHCLHIYQKLCVSTRNDLQHILLPPSR